MTGSVNETTTKGPSGRVVIGRLARPSLDEVGETVAPNRGQACRLADGSAQQRVGRLAMLGVQSQAGANRNRHVATSHVERLAQRVNQLGGNALAIGCGIDPGQQHRNASLPIEATTSLARRLARRRTATLRRNTLADSVPIEA